MFRYKIKHLMAEKEFRDRTRLSLISVAEATGVNRMTLSKMVNRPGANVTTDALNALCNYFECGIEDLVEHVPDDK